MHRILRTIVAALALVGCAASELVSMPTEDGGVLHAALSGSGDYGVVLAHGGRFTKESWAQQVPQLTRAGYRVLAIDFRGRGASHGGSQAGSAEDAHFDVLAAVRYLRRHGATRVAVIGASFGGSASARAATLAEPGEIDRIVLLAAGEIKHPESMQGRKLFITSRADFRGAGDLRLPGIRDQFERATGPKELLILDGSAHAQFLFESDQAERLMSAILSFLGAP